MSLVTLFRPVTHAVVPGCGTDPTVVGAGGWVPRVVVGTGVGTRVVGVPWHQGSTRTKSVPSHSQSVPRPSPYPASQYPVPSPSQSVPSPSPARPSQYLVLVQPGPVST